VTIGQLVNDAASRRSLSSAATRTLSDGALAIGTAVGLIGTTTIAMYFQGLWRIGLACVALSAFGALGIFERSTVRPHWLFLVLRTLATLTGGVAAFGLLYMVIEFALRQLKY